MPAAKTALQQEPSPITPPDEGRRKAQIISPAPGPRRITNHSPAVRPFPATPRRDISFQPRVPVITGEANYRGMMPVDGVITGQIGAAGSVMTIKQRPRNGMPDDSPELNGELSFKDMLRINGHIAGKV